MEEIELVIKIKAKFHAYDTLAKNKRARRSIISWVRETMEGCSHIPLYVDKDENGSMIEDCTRKVSIEIKEKP